MRLNHGRVGCSGAAFFGTPASCKVVIYCPALSVPVFPSPCLSLPPCPSPLCSSPVYNCLLPIPGISLRICFPLSFPFSPFLLCPSPPFPSFPHSFYFLTDRSIHPSLYLPHCPLCPLCLTFSLSPLSSLFSVHSSFPHSADLPPLCPLVGSGREARVFSGTYQRTEQAKIHVDP